MNFYAIGPLAYLNAITGPDYRYHMVLAQYLYDKGLNPTDYFMFYRRRCMLPQYTVILDNGAYEGAAVSSSYLLEATLKLNPHIVVLPDVPHDMCATLDRSAEFKEMLKRHSWKGNTMTVVHAEPGNYEQFCHSYREACKLSSVVGISKLTQDFGCEGGRVGFLRSLKLRFNREKQHHALGMKNGSLEELSQLAESGLFAGCDSSSPIWRGLGRRGEFDPDACWNGANLLGAQDCFYRVQTICNPKEVSIASGSGDGPAV